ncbi:hypothetical protein BDSB_03975 [Burkholderia dolosa PC543]|nr:hypothetical protein BDSB_03975 [Burkholderia dolosa PC543]
MVLPEEKRTCAAGPAIVPATGARSQRGNP